MTSVHDAYEALLERFVRWAENEDNIRVSLLIGSRARTETPADEWADADIVTFAHRSEAYLRSTDWLNAIGNPLITFLERTATGGGVERRVFFEGGLDADFPFFPIDRFDATCLDAGALYTLRRGCRILIDKDGLAATLLASLPPLPTPQPPTQEEFDQVVHDFWYHTIWSAKKFARGELLMAKLCADNYMKGLLIRMCKWHARAVHGWDYDTWHSGRFFERWADKRVIEKLSDAYARYDRDDIGRALFATMDTFRWIAQETANLLGHAYPTVADETATAWVKVCFSRLRDCEANSGRE